MSETGPGKKYMQYLPAIFHEGEDTFIERYLKIFEKVINGIDDGELDGKKGIFEMLDIISDLFHPSFTFLCDETAKGSLAPITSEQRTVLTRYLGNGTQADEFLNDFLRWLASWMALVLNEDWELEKKREVIARILPIYRMRGTKRGLEEYLKIYVGKHITIIDEVEPFRVGVTSHIGKQARVGGLPPYFFIVEVDVMHLFNWDNVPGKEDGRLLQYLKEDFDISWAEDARISKSGDGRTIQIQEGANSAKIIMDEKKETAILTIRDGNTYELNVKKENGRPIIYNTKNIDVSHIKKWRNKKKVIEDIINSEKPMHTNYWLNIKHPCMTVGVNSRIGENTLL
jgi:phage tail-like protein